MTNVQQPRPVLTKSVQILVYTHNAVPKLYAVPIIITKLDATVPMVIVAILWYVVNDQNALETMNVPSILPAEMNVVKIHAIAV